jgi:hypothetical protein
VIPTPKWGVRENSFFAVVTRHWNGGRPGPGCDVDAIAGSPSEPSGGHPKARRPVADREVAVTMNRMRCKPSDGKAWTTIRVRELRERPGIAPFDPEANRVETISADETATRLGICVGSVQELIREGVLPATQLLSSAPWQVPIWLSKAKPSR